MLETLLKTLAVMVVSYLVFAAYCFMNMSDAAKEAQPSYKYRLATKVLIFFWAAIIYRVLSL